MLSVGRPPADCCHPFCPVPVVIDAFCPHFPHIPHLLHLRLAHVLCAVVRVAVCVGIFGKIVSTL